MMLIPHFFFFASILLQVLISSVICQDQPVLDERIMTLGVEAAKLSALAYDNAANYTNGDVDNNNNTVYTHPDYESITFYNEEPDQVIVAKKDGRCYLSFRGTTLAISDWLQNLGIGSIDIYKDNNNATGESCNARAGYADFLFSSLVEQGAANLQACASTCTDPDDCVILTGHSQGGAIATLAAITLYSYNPILITYGQPLAVSTGCDLLRPERIYRYVNSLLLKDEGEGGEPEIVYDPVPLYPALGQGRGHYGYSLLLGDDSTALKFLGINDDDSGFAPGPQVSAVPHLMSGLDPPHTYEARVTSLLDNGQFPVTINGFSGNTPCDPENPMLCGSNECTIEEVCTTSFGIAMFGLNIMATTTMIAFGSLVPVFL